MVILQGQEVTDICFLEREIYYYSVYLMQNVSRKNIYLDIENALPTDNFKKFKAQNKNGFDFLVWFCSWNYILEGT